MQWYKITISTTIYAQDQVTAILYDMGITGIEIINNVPITEAEKEEMFIDILPEVNEKDDTSDLIFYLENDDNLTNILNEVENKLIDLRESGIKVGSGNVEVTTTKDEDWANNWKQYFKPFRVSDDIIIKPTWVDDISKEEVKEDDIIIEIDPEMAFGTGSHETTRLAIDGIKKYQKVGYSILDIGCGSGILSIISRKLGADKVTAIDVDKNAVKTARDNGIINNILAEDINFLYGDVLNQKTSPQLDNKIGLGNYDIVVANILTEVIINLSEVVGKYLKPRGYFISTGILNYQADKVQVALEKNGFDVIEINYMGDWVSIIARKNDV